MEHVVWAAVSVKFSMAICLLPEWLALKVEDCFNVEIIHILRLEAQLAGVLG